MKVLVVGGGGREHALAWKISQSPMVDKVYCAPGNGGIAQIAECVDINAMDFEALADFAQKEGIGLTVVGMDDPLVGGIVDIFTQKGLRIFGPSRDAAILEGSKAFSKELMRKYNIPTARYEVFDSAQEAEAFLEFSRYPVVLKADGLALGKGVLICGTYEEAVDGVNVIMRDKKFGDAGNRLVIEEFLTGREVSVLSFCDGKTCLPMASAQDHKRALDGDKGPNTGGMGTFSPSPFYTPETDAWCREHIFNPTVAAMNSEGRTFKGVIFFGLMLTDEGPRVLEYNARFGDPEAQVVLPRMENDIVDIFDACIDGTLDRVRLKFSDSACVCVCMASGGYPGAYRKGLEISGLENLNGKDGVYVFHAGTKRGTDGRLITNGGRVLGVTALGGDLKAARANAYDAVQLVNFEGAYYRSDIGKAIDEA